MKIHMKSHDIHTKSYENHMWVLCPMGPIGRNVQKPVERSKSGRRFKIRSNVNTQKRHRKKSVVYGISTQKLIIRKTRNSRKKKTSGNSAQVGICGQTLLSRGHLLTTLVTVWTPAPFVNCSLTNELSGMAIRRSSVQS